MGIFTKKAGLDDRKTWVKVTKRIIKFIIFIAIIGMIASIILINK